MKKKAFCVCILFALCAFLSCVLEQQFPSDPEEENPPEEEPEDPPEEPPIEPPEPVLSPPEWIIGAWIDEDSLCKWVFTSDNALYTVSGVTFDFKKIDEDPDVTVTEDTSSDSYTVTMEESGLQMDFRLVRLSAATLEYHLSGVLPIILIKQ